MFNEIKCHHKKGHLSKKKNGQTIKLQQKYRTGTVNSADVVVLKTCLRGASPCDRYLFGLRKGCLVIHQWIKTEKKKTTTNKLSFYHYDENHEN